MKRVLLMSALSCLTASAKAPLVTYNPSDFINPNKIVEKPVEQPIPTNKVSATFGYGDDPRVLEAYRTYVKSGRMPQVTASGFITRPYSTHTRVMLACAPLHLCIIQLEAGENINNIELGDSADWAVHSSLIGTAQNGSYQVALKPRISGIATDLVITTTKRTYQFGLVSQGGRSLQVISFYYPEESLSKAIAEAHALTTAPAAQNDVSPVTVARLEQLNFNYAVSGQPVAWQPTRIFDDGDKTFIQMPSLAERLELPVLYVQREQGMALINYRYKRPYYIIDGLFKTAYLIEGKGKTQAKVIIHNNNIV